MRTEPKLCKDCKHYSYGLRHRLCAAPPHKYNLIDGEREIEFADIRRKHGPCGKSAAMFEARAPQPQWIEQRIFPRPVGGSSGSDPPPLLLAIP